MRAIYLLLSGVFCALILFAQPTWAQSDQEIKQAIIEHSLATYPGNCPCPYNTDRAGRRCGGRSAYSKPGGYSPICYPEDVTDAMLEAYRHQYEQGVRTEPEK